MIGKHAAALGAAIVCAWSAPALASFADADGGSFAPFSYFVSGATVAAGSEPGDALNNVGPASSSADLATGELHAFAHGGVHAPGFVFPAPVGATGNFADTLHILGPIAGIVTGTLPVHLDGELSKDPFEGSTIHEATAGGTFSFLVANTNVLPVRGEQLQVFLISGLYGGASCSSSSDPSLPIHAVTVCGVGAGAYSYDFLLPFEISDFARDIDIQASASVSTEGSGVADFGHTASLGLTLPDGLTYTSDSGVFLSERPSAVPEPATLGLLAAAIGLLAGATRRHAER